MNFIFLLLTLITLYKTSQAQSILCSDGERADKCGCDLSCDTLDAACRGVCTDYERCFCQDNYVRETDSSSRCIPREKCDVCSKCDNLECRKFEKFLV